MQVCTRWIVAALFHTFKVSDSPPDSYGTVRQRMQIRVAAIAGLVAMRAYLTSVAFIHEGAVGLA